MKVFISHSHRVAEFARALSVRLRSTAVEVKSDGEILPGEPWLTTVEHAVKAVDYVVVLVDPETSSQQRREWSEVLYAALGSSRPRILGVRIDNAEMPAFLKHSSVIEVESGDLASAVQVVANRLFGAGKWAIPSAEDLFAAPPEQRADWRERLDEIAVGTSALPD